MALCEDTLNLLEVPLGKSQRFNVLRWTPHVLILAVRSIDAEATPVIVTLATDRPSRVVIFRCYIALSVISCPIMPIHVITIARLPLLFLL